MNIKKFLWDLFPAFYSDFDTFKDVNKKGMLQRFVESLGEEIDDTVIPHLEESSNTYFLNNIEALKTDQKLLEHLIRLLGSPPGIIEGEDYRKMLQYIVPVYQIKGTELSYQLFINLLGFDVQLIEHEPTSFSEFGDILLYDNGFYYDELNLYDSLEGEQGILCPFCSDYSLILTPRDILLTTSIIEKISEIVKFIEPINARLREIILALPAFEEEVSLCFNQSLNIFTVTILLYDMDTPLLYDDGVVYDSDNEIELLVKNIDCQGEPLEEGIDFWAIGEGNIVQ